MPMNGNVKDLRERKVLTRKELSELSGVDEATIYRIERGRTGRPRPSTLRKLAAALGVDAETLASIQHRMDI